MRLEVLFVDVIRGCVTACLDYLTFTYLCGVPHAQRRPNQDDIATSRLLSEVKHLGGDQVGISESLILWLSFLTKFLHFWVRSLTYC